MNVLDNKGVSLYNLGNHIGSMKYFDQSLDINLNDKNALTYKQVIINETSNHS